MLFFLVSEQKQGKPNIKVINELEDYLIQTALTANDGLLNVVGTSRPEFSIKGVLRARSGKPSKAATELKKCLSLK